jgi:hypothetical protein
VLGVLILFSSYRSPARKDTDVAHDFPLTEGIQEVFMKNPLHHFAKGRFRE